MAEATKETTQDAPPFEENPAILPEATPEPAPEPDPMPEREPSVEPALVRPVARRGSGLGRFLGLVLGGALAAAGGFGIALYGAQQGWSLLVPPAGPEPLMPQIEALKAEIAQLRATPAPQPDLSPLESRLAALEARPDAPANDGTQALQQQVAALEQKIATLDPGDPAAIKAQIDAQVAARMQEAKAESEALKAEAEALRVKAEQRAALLALQTALQSGVGVADAVAQVKAAAVTLPDPLPAFTADPITLAALQDGFEPAARAALSAARAAEQGSGTMTDRLSTFLLNQTGARSMTPREGSDPDAVLSRMRARLAEGDVAAARALIADLPEPARAPLADWSAQAESWAAARAALAQLIPAE